MKKPFPFQPKVPKAPNGKPMKSPKGAPKAEPGKKAPPFFKGGGKVKC